MPNWVYNNISISGKRDDLIAFANKASQRHETQWLSKDWIRNEDGTNTRVPEEERTIEIELSEEQPLSFWNFVRPTDEELPYYFGNKTKPEDEPDPNATSEERMAKALEFTGSGWYDWNIRNWGVKWDANDENGDTPDLDDLKDHDSISYSFSTAWSIPEPIFRAMIEQHPELDFDFSAEEEQGWGAEYTSTDTEDEDGKPIKELSLTREWDIPDSHADYVDRDNEDGCSCSHSDDEEDWYDDCPRSEKDYFVVVSKTYRVSATNEENAYNLATDNDPDEQMELIDDNTTIFIADENGKRLYPTLGNGSLMNEPDQTGCIHHFIPVYESKDGVETLTETSCVFCHEVKPDGEDGEE